MDILNLGFRSNRVFYVYIIEDLMWWKEYYKIKNIKSYNFRRLVSNLVIKLINYKLWIVRKISLISVGVCFMKLYVKEFN